MRVTAADVICLCVCVCDVQLLQELDQHTSHVNTLCFSQDGCRLFSGDSNGNICVWVVDVEDDASLSGISVFHLLSSVDIVYELHYYLTHFCLCQRLT